MKLPYKRLRGNAVEPVQSHDGDAGVDLVATEDLALRPGERASVPTGIAFALDPGTVGWIVPRSGLAIDHGVTVLNAPGVIDSGYRGEVRVLLVNLDPVRTFQVAAGDRVAQLVVTRFEKVDLVLAAELSPTERGTTGFGSTGA